MPPSSPTGRVYTCPHLHGTAKVPNTAWSISSKWCTGSGPKQLKNSSAAGTAAHNTERSCISAVANLWHQRCGKQAHVLVQLNNPVNHNGVRQQLHVETAAGQGSRGKAGRVSR